MQVFRKVVRIPYIGIGFFTLLVAVAPKVRSNDATVIEQQPSNASVPLPPIRVPRVFGDHMVLQRDRPLPIWGRSMPDESIHVSFAKSQMETRADLQGNWRLTLPPQSHGGPHALTIRGKECQLTFEDVMVGEVWICSGQSNMEMSVKESFNPHDAIASATYPQIRFLNVANSVAKEPQSDFEGQWSVCSPDTADDISAVAYYYGRNLLEHLKVPIGLIDASWGGSLCESWMSREALTADPDFSQILHRALGDNIGKGSGMYNAMLHPLIPFAIRGTIWYQGESNSARASQYQKLFPTLIRDWRSKWGQGDFPFYYVQLAPLDRHGDEWVELKEAQLKTLSEPHTGMAVISDLDLPGLHPANKEGVGIRLALWALAKDYGLHDVVYSGPLYRSMAVHENSIRVHFNHSVGLASRDHKPLSDFTIAGSDRKFHPAVATVMGGTIIVHSDVVAQPVSVRFGWTDTAQPNLINSAGLPASPFRTDEWSGVTNGRQ